MSTSLALVQRGRAGERDAYGRDTGGEIVTSPLTAGVATETGPGVSQRADTFIEQILDDEEARLLSQLPSIQFRVAQEAKRKVTTVPSGRSEEVYTHLAERARRRFLAEDLYPSELWGLSGPPTLAVARLAAIKPDGSLYQVHEAAVRVLLYMLSALNREDFKPGTVDTFPADEDEVLDLVQGATVDTFTEHILTLGVCHMVMSIAKPFVSIVTAAAKEMASNLRTELQLGQNELTETTHAEMYKKYFAKMNMKVLARTIIDRRFEGANWLTAYIARYGAGTSHLSLIADFIKVFPECPLWKYIPSHEISNMADAFEAVYQDPLALYPSGVDDSPADERLRVAGMPTVVFLAFSSLKAAGYGFWGRYQNVPAITSFGILSVAEAAQALHAYLQSRRLKTDAVRLLLEGSNVEEIEPDLAKLHLGMFVQRGGKKIPDIRRLAAGAY